jgi:hypothetical protein
MVPDDPNFDPMESNRRAAAINELLRHIGLSDGAETRWWNLTRYAELGDRTPTQAWLADDHQGVEKLVAQWYADSEAVARRYRDDPDLMASLRERSAALHSA